MKIKKLFILIFMFSILISFSSCVANKTGENNNSEAEQESKEVTYEEITDTFDLYDFQNNITAHEYTYSDSYFLGDRMDSKMLMVSFISSFLSKKPNGLSADTKFKHNFTNMGYSNFYCNDYIYGETDIDNIGVLFASKNVYIKNKDYTIIAASIRGFDYGFEWLGDFIVGNEGDHKNFQKCSMIVIDELNKYATTIGAKDVILWITGYSRGGAVASMTSAYIDNYINYKKTNNWLMDEYTPKLSFNIELDDLYCYTFESPRGALKTNVEKLKDVTTNIINICNLSDIVPMVVPDELGFDRYGTIKNYLIDPESEKFKDILKYYKYEYSLNVNQYAFSFTSKAEDDEVIKVGSFEFYIYKLDTVVSVKDVYSSVASDLVEMFETRNNYSSIVDVSLRAIGDNYLSLSNENRKKFIDTIKTKFSEMSYISFLSSKAVTRLFSESFEAVGVTLKKSETTAISNFYDMVLKVAINEIEGDSDGYLLKRLATIYMNSSIFIANHAQEFTYAFICLL